jgi:hypothetical protein
MADKKDKKKTDDDAIITAGLTGAAAEVVDRFGSANKEHLVGYSGVDNEIGQVLSKGLKSISESKVNPEYRDNNIHQQSGFSAEVQSTSRKNAENIINKKTTRHTRTDDIDRQQYGENEIGGKNDQLYDHVDLDSNGNPIAGSATQMKFVGHGGKDTLDKLTSKDFQKYFDNDVPIEVPSDYYDGVRIAAGEKVEEIQKQIDYLKKSKPDEKALIKEKQKQLKKMEGIRDGKSIRKSNVSSKEAEFARLHPELATAGDIAKVSHEAGLEQAKTGAVIGGSISIIKNFVALAKDEKTPEEALLEVAKDTSSAAAMSYSTAFTGSVLKGAMQNSKSAFTRVLSKTNLPATIVAVTLETGKTLTKYLKGEIDGVQCFEELGEKGTGLLSSAMFGALGQIAIPIPVVGGLIGSMIGYALSSACYGQLLNALKDAKKARIERIQIEAECEEAVRMIRQYRAEMETIISEYLSDQLTMFHTAFDEMEAALDIGDIDGFIAGANKVTLKLGGKPQFKNMPEFESFMDSSERLLL